jgi:uncharacterized membrane protein YheB (UPF0754 family)
MSEDVLRALVTIGFGALAGGLTNTVAIWMLFHPYEPPRLFGKWRLSFLQGAIPKSQSRLAAAIGRTVGNRLLTPDDLTRTFSNREFRSAFDERLAGFLDAALHQERGSLREMLPPDVADDVESILQDAVAHGMTRLRAYLEEPDFEDFVRNRTDGLIEQVSDQPVGGILTPARGAAVEATAEEWLVGMVASDDFAGAVDDYLARGAEKLLRPDRTFEQILPLGLVASVERAIASYLPLAAERLGGLLEDPQARAKFESTIHDLLHRFLRDLKFHQRVVAKLVVKEDTVDRVLDTIEAEGAQRLSEILRDPAVQTAIARGVNEAIVDLLRRPVADVLGTADEESVVEARATLGSWAVDMARDAETRAFLVEKLRSGLERAGAKTWGEVLERIPAERIAQTLVAGARTDTAARIATEAAQRLATDLLDRPLGVPSRWLPVEAPARIEAAIGDPLWSWLQTQVPSVVERIDVARRVEEKVLHFPTPKMEELVRKVTNRELKMIVKLGYLLGAIIGSALVAVDAALR